jgi:hypothetical protein
LRISDCGSRIADCGVRNHCRIQIADCGLRIADCGSRIADCGVRNHCRIQIADCGLRIADCGSRIADLGLRIADCGFKIFNIHLSRVHGLQSTIFNQKSKNPVVRCQVSGVSSKRQIVIENRNRGPARRVGSPKDQHLKFRNSQSEIRNRHSPSVISLNFLPA